MTRAVLLAAGWPEAAVDRALHSERLYQLHPGVYSVVPPEHLSDEGHLIAATAAVGPSSVLAHGTAGFRQSVLRAPPVAIHLASPFPLVAPAGVVLHRSRLRSTDVTDDGRFRITVVERTLLDLAVDYRPSALLRALAEAEFQHDLRPQQVLAVLRRGHPGSRRLRRALDLHVPGYGQARSRLEKAFREALVRAGVPLPERNVRIGAYLVDCVWEAEKVVVELDGNQHLRPHQATVDAERDLWLRRNGYIVLRSTWAQVTERPHEVVADLLRELNCVR